MFLKRYTVPSSFIRLRFGESSFWSASTRVLNSGRVGAPCLRFVGSLGLTDSGDGRCGRDVNVIELDAVITAVLHPEELALGGVEIGSFEGF